MEDNEYYKALITNMLNTMTLKMGVDCSKDVDIIDGLIIALNDYKNEINGVASEDNSDLTIAKAQQILNMEHAPRSDRDRAANFMIEAYEKGQLPIRPSKRSAPSD